MAHDMVQGADRPAPGWQVLHGLALGVGGGLLITWLADAFLSIQGPVLLVPLVMGATTGVAVPLARLKTWAVVVIALACLPALVGMQLGQLHLLASRIPVPPGGERLDRRVGLGDWMSGPFAQSRISAPGSAEDIAAFYCSSLADRGWTFARRVDLPDRSFYTFTKGESGMLVVVWHTPQAPQGRIEVTHTLERRQG